MARGTRPRKNRIEVWCDNEEFALIKAKAENTGLSNSAYLRNLGKGHQPGARSIVRRFTSLLEFMRINDA
jgi:hypothetical protein